MERGSIYPSWRYHAEKDPVLCMDAAQDAALGDEWADTPAAFPPKVEEPVSESDAPADEAPKKRGRKAKV